MIRDAIVLAGGFGTRLQSVVKEVPKPMADISGRPFLEYQLNYLKSHGIENIVLSVGYLHEVVENHFGDRWNGLNIQYAVEDEPLGTGGAVQYALSFLKGDEVLILNGDTLFEADLKAFQHFHGQKQADCSLVLREVEDGSRYGVVKLNSENRIQEFAEKGSVSGSALINGGIYILKRQALMKANKQGKFSLERDFFEAFVSNIRLCGMSSSAYFLDIGIPEDYEKAQHEFEKLGY